MELDAKKTNELLDEILTDIMNKIVEKTQDETIMAVQKIFNIEKFFSDDALEILRVMTDNKEPVTEYLSIITEINDRVEEMCEKYKSKIETEGENDNK